MKDEHFSFGHLESLDSWPLVLIQALYLDSSNYPGGNYPSGNYPGGNYPGWQLSGWQLSGWQLSCISKHISKTHKHLT